MVAVCLVSLSAAARSSSAILAAKDMDSIITEAAERFAVPQLWIRAIIDVESHGNPRAVSPKGAIGLMQLRPRTYNALRLRYALGADPLDPRDNVLAGTAYLRELYDTFGGDGFLAAYNAGPKRYREHLATSRRLPLETGAYVAQLRLRLAGSLPQDTPIDVASEKGWQASTLFPAHLKLSVSERANMFVSMSPTDSQETSGSIFRPDHPDVFVVQSSKQGAPQ